MKSRKRFKKNDWLALGLKQLASEGVAGLTVEALCNSAERTRGSFYHHFEDHRDFVQALLLFWKQQNTLDVAGKTVSEKPEMRTRKLSDLANRLDQNLERAVRQFAQSNPVAFETVREVDRIRTEFVAGLYMERGLEKDQALEVAQIEYAAFVGSQIVWPEMSAGQRLKLANRFAFMVNGAFAPNMND